MLPSLFISHGSPMLALTPTPAHQFLRELGQTLRPKAIVVVSAHWETPELLISQSAHPETLHDFGGFPAALFAVQYPAPGDPALAATLGKTLGARVVERGMDHGAWVPLSLMYPEARLPVVSLSLPSRWSNAALMELGQRLAHLRSEGILVVGSGSLTHNLHALLPQGSQAPVLGGCLCRLGTHPTGKRRAGGAADMANGSPCPAQPSHAGALPTVTGRHGSRGSGPAAAP